MKPKTIIFAQSYRSAKDRSLRHYKSWVKTGLDLVCVNTTDGPHEWPVGANVISAGREAIIHGDGLAIINRLMDILCAFIEKFDNHSHIMVIESDCVFVRGVPNIHPKLFTTPAGTCPKEWGVKATRFWHPPLWMDKPTAEKVLTKSDSLIELGEIENGSTDVFLGRVFDELGLTPVYGGCWTCNSRDMKIRLPEAVNAVRNGAWFIHGVDTKDQLEQIMLHAT